MPTLRYNIPLAASASPDSELLAAHGVIYAVSYAPGGSGVVSLSAFSISTGKTLWNQSGQVDGTQFIGAVGDGMLFETIGYSASSYVVALNALTGNPVWSNETDNAATLNYADNTLFVNGYSGLYAMNALNGKPLWGPVAPDVTGSSFLVPAISNGIVYDYANNGSLYAFGEGTGALLWSSTFSNGFSGNNIIASNGIVYVSDALGYVYALDAKGSIVWQTHAGFGAVEALAQGQLLVSDEVDSELWSLDASTGATLWSTSVAATSLGVGGNVTVASTATGKLEGINMTDGSVLWSYPTQYQITSNGNLILPGGVIVVTTVNSIFILEPSGSSSAVSGPFQNQLGLAYALSVLPWVLIPFTLSLQEKRKLSIPTHA